MGRIIVVGDRKQSIYGFRGADITAMPNLQKMLEGRPNGCKVFPLSVCRRSPKSHIRLAQAIVPDIKWCIKERDGIEAPEGEIYQISLEQAVEMMREGDMGIARVNRVLVPVAYQCIKLKKKVIIRGKDIGKGLIALIKKLKPTGVANLLFKIEQYESQEMKKLAEAEGLADGPDVAKRLSRKSQIKLDNLLDKTGCIAALCDGMNNLSEVIANIEEIFSDFDDTGKPKDAIVLGTVHRTKGLEAFNIFMIDPENFPHPMATKEWEVEQERNLAYIGVTRAKFQLDDKGNVVQPGRLIFIGQCPSIFRAEWLMGKAVYPVKVEAPKSDTQALRDKVIEFWVKNNTPREAAEKMVKDMTDDVVRQCAMIAGL